MRSTYPLLIDTPGGGERVAVIHRGDELCAGAKSLTSSAHVVLVPAQFVRFASAISFAVNMSMDGSDPDSARVLRNEQMGVCRVEES